MWATTTFQPEAPFRVMRADGSIAVFDTVHHLAEAIGQREVSIAHAFLVDAKIRPVVILQGRPRGALPAILPAALVPVYLHRLSKMRDVSVHRRQMALLSAAFKKRL